MSCSRQSVRWFGGGSHSVSEETKKPWSRCEVGRLYHGDGKIFRVNTAKVSNRLVRGTEVKRVGLKIPPGSATEDFRDKDALATLREAGTADGSFQLPASARENCQNDFTDTA